MTISCAHKGKSVQRKKTLWAHLLPRVKRNKSSTWKWWEGKRRPHAVRKWITLEHNGPVFAADYQRLPRNVRFYYDGQPLALSKEAEEVAVFYGKALGEKHTQLRIFNQNFFLDWQQVMTEAERNVIKRLSLCDFSEIHEFYRQEAERKKQQSYQERMERKAEEDRLKAVYGYCLVDGHKQKIINFKMEPPGLFRGRGNHPLTGRLKARVQPEDITINIGRTAPVPKPPDGHQWGGVVHDNTVCWLARWTENIFGTYKYIMLNQSSKMKGQREIEKFETARRLKNHISSIRRNYGRDMSSPDMESRQRAVALYFIDRLALRTGNEKGEDTADTVGCCSLRVEHVKTSLRRGVPWVFLDFPGKDSIRFVKSVSVDESVLRNLRLFQAGKQKWDYLFDLLSASKLNRYLTEVMPGLTVKVFRTYCASKELEAELARLTKHGSSVEEKLFAYHTANLVVAVLCNHRRAVPRTYRQSLRNLERKLQTKVNQLKELARETKHLKPDRRHIRKVLVLQNQITKLQFQTNVKKDTKHVALGTSKMNYLDPRITVAWCLKWNVPIGKVYNKTQRERFRWAIETTNSNFKF